MEVRIEDTKNWKKCIDALVNLVKEGALEFDTDGLKLQAMDPSQIAMVNFKMGKEEFSKYDVDSKQKVGINLENLSKILSRVRGKEKLTMKLNNGRFEMIFDGDKSKRSFRIPLIDAVPGPSKDLKIDYTATVKMKGGLFKEILKDVALVSPHVLLVADAGRFRVEANGDGGDLEMEYQQGEAELDVKRTTSAIFSQEYLDDIVRGCEDDGELMINLGAPTPEDRRPKPLCVKYSIGNAKLTYYLAPRIETD